MPKDLVYFRPAGPLQYLITHKDSTPMLGLYHDIRDGKLVLLGDCFGLTCVFWPELEDLMDAFEERVDIADMLWRSRWTYKGMTSLSVFHKIMVRYWSLKFFSCKIYEKADWLLYPNFYYVLTEHIGGRAAKEVNV